MKILISACLFGQKVRYDGADCAQSHTWLLDIKKEGLLIPFCPEVEAGMGVPRPPIELLNGEIVNQRGDILTRDFDPVFEKLSALIERERPVLAILKEKSPSCGVNQVYDGSFSGNLIPGQGIMARFLADSMPVFSENELDLAQKTYLEIRAQRQK